MTATVRHGPAFVKPQDKTCRLSRAMTAAEAAALLVADNGDPPLGAYVILSLITGIWTEETRALREHKKRQVKARPATGLPGCQTT
jgi:hypothetical protein